MSNLFLNSFFDRVVDNLPLGGFMFVLGMVIVFFGMAVIVLVVTILGRIMTASTNKADKQEQESPVEEVAPVAIEEDIPDHVKAAIVAAITAYYFGQNSNCEFKIKKIKRI